MKKTFKLYKEDYGYTTNSKIVARILTPFLNVIKDNKKRLDKIDNPWGIKGYQNAYKFAYNDKITIKEFTQTIDAENAIEIRQFTNAARTNYICYADASNKEECEITLFKVMHDIDKKGVPIAKSKEISVNEWEQALRDFEKELKLLFETVNNVRHDLIDVITGENIRSLSDNKLYYITSIFSDLSYFSLMRENVSYYVLKAIQDGIKRYNNNTIFYGEIKDRDVIPTAFINDFCKQLKKDTNKTEREYQKEIKDYKRKFNKLTGEYEIEAPLF